jgi:Flp pilus assembly protein TadD
MKIREHRNAIRRSAAGLVVGLVTVASFACGDRGHDHGGSGSIASSQSPQPAPSSEQTNPTLTPTVPVADKPLEPVIDPKTAWRDGVVAWQAGDFKSALEHLRVAADLKPQDAYVQYLYGLSLWKSGRLDEAETALVQSSTLKGDSIKTWINLARVRLERDAFDTALEATDRALAIDPDSADALHQRGRALNDLRRTDEAIESLEKARGIAPDNGYIANTLGYLLLRQGNVEKAVPNLEAARDRLPQVAFVRNNLGMAYERMGDRVRAAEEYRAALQAGDSNGKASASLARIEPLLRDRIATSETPGDPQPDGDTPSDQTPQH